MDGAVTIVYSSIVPSGSFPETLIAEEAPSSIVLEISVRVGASFTGVTVIVTVAVLLVRFSSSVILNVKESEVPSPPEWV